MLESRSGNTVRNSIFAITEQGIHAIVSFICRTVFVYSLGKTYLGFNGLFSDILNLLSLAELGFGTAILYAMFKPMANHDEREVAALLGLYRKVYTAVGVVITIIGILLTPFLDFFISDMPDISELPVIYLLYLFNTTASYFFVYKRSLLIVDQKNYIISIIWSIFIVVQNMAQILCLLCIKNYILYLGIQVICTFLNNIAISIYVDKKYAYLSKYKNESISDEEKNSIFTNVKAMFLSKISSAVVSSTDNILISKFVSTITLGIYSNYTLFTSILRTILTKIFEGITGSVGNLVAVESSEKSYEVFKKIWFVNYWIVAFCTGTLYILINPFIKLWLGNDYLLAGYIVLIICVNFFMRFIRNTFITFTDTYGLFVDFKFKCIVEAIINFVVSVFFVCTLEMGIFGVLLGTFISNITTNFWFEPYVLYTRKFNKSLVEYFLTFIKYIVVMIIAIVPTKIICDYIGILGGWVSFIIQLIICVAVVNSILIIFYCKTDEFKYFLQMIQKIGRKYIKVKSR